MAGKARVHELAKELHVTSKEILARLSDQGEFVKSASSTIAAPVARRLRASYNNDDDQDHKSARTGQDQPARPDIGSNTTAPKRPVKTEPTPRRRDTSAMPRPQLTEAQSAAICQSYRQLYVNAPHLGSALEKISAKYAAEYGVTRAAVRKIVMADKRRHGADYAAMDKKRRTTDYAALRNLSQQIQRQKREERRPVKPPLPATEQTPGTAAQPALSRARKSGLPALVTNLDVASCAEIVLGKSVNQDCVTDLQEFDPAAPDYGYLAWRYSTVHQRLHREPPETTAAGQLAALARVVDSDRTQLDPMQAGGDILEHPGAAKHILEREHRDLIDTDDVAGSADDERRHIREKETFLHRAVLLLIAAPHLADRLWQMLDTLAPRPRDQLIQDSPALSAALDRFRAHMAAVEALLSTDETTFTGFLDRSRTELADLQAGRYDYLRAYRGTAPGGAARRDTEELPFVVLPPGEALRNFLASLRSKAGRHFDQNRVNVLDDLEHHFGAHRCRWHHGSIDSRGINNRYLILTIASGDGEHAVAISPLAGEHATYVVRHDYCQDPWTVVLAGSKIRARRRGARRLPFSTSASSTDQYTAMRERIIALLEFENPTT